MGNMIQEGQDGQNDNILYGNDLQDKRLSSNSKLFGLNNISNKKENAYQILSSPDYYGTIKTNNDDYFNKNKRNTIIGKPFNVRPAVNDILYKINNINTNTNTSTNINTSVNQITNFKEEENYFSNEGLSLRKSLTTDNLENKEIKDEDLHSIISNRINKGIHKKSNSIEFEARGDYKKEEDLTSQLSFNTSSKYTNLWFDNDDNRSVYNDFFEDKSYFTVATNTKTKMRNNVDIIRQEYIYSLIKNKIWIPGKNKRNVDFNTIIIFDWDDTLFATSYIAPDGFYEEGASLSEEDEKNMANLEFAVLKLLTASFNKKADVYIITNSEKSWVYFSANKYMPSVRDILDKCIIISARDEYSKVFPEDSRRWKTEAYLSIKSRYENVSSNILNFGDTPTDIECGGLLAKLFKESYLKSIKFRENPTIQELIKQLNMILSQFDMIFKVVKNITVKVEKK